MATFNVQAAMKAGYSQQEVNDFLRQNPNIQTSGYSAPSKPAGEGLLASILNPLMRYGKNALGASFEASRALRSTLGDKNAYVNQETGETAQNPFLTEQELSAFDSRKGQGVQNVIAQASTQNSGLRQGLKDTANAASYAIPFGKGAGLLNKVLAPGAFAGGLQAVSEEEVSPLSVILGASGGATGAGMLHGLGVLGGKTVQGAKNILTRGGQSFIKGAEEKATQEFIKASPEAFYKAVSEHGIDLRKLYKQYAGGLSYDDLLGAVTERNKGGVLNQQLSSAENIIKHHTSVAGNNIRISGDDIIKQLKNASKSIGKELGGQNRSEALKEIIRQAELKYKKGLTVKQAVSLIREANEKFGASIVDDQVGAVASASQKLEANTLKGILKKMFPEIKDAFRTQEEILTLRPVLSKARSKVATTGAGKADFGLPDIVAGLSGAATGNSVLGPIGGIAGFGLGVGGRRALESPTVQKAAGNVLTNLGKTGGSSAINNPILQQILMQGASRVGGGARIVAGIGGQMPTTDTNQGSYNEGGQQSQDQIQSDLPNGQNTGGIVPQQQGASQLTPDIVAMAQLVLKKDDAARIKAAYDIQQGGQKQKTMTEMDKKFAFANQEANSALKLLNDNEGKIPVGPILGSRLSKSIQEKTGSQSKEATQFYAKVGSARTAVKNALLGANQSPQEIESLLDFTFDSSLPPNILKERITSLIGSLSGYQQNIGGGGSDLLQQILSAGQ